MQIQRSDVYNLIGFTKSEEFSRSYNKDAYDIELKKLQNSNFTANGSTYSFSYNDSNKTQRIYTLQNGVWSDAQMIQNGQNTTTNSNNGN